MILFVIVGSVLAQGEKSGAMALLDATPSYRLVVLNAQRAKTDAEIQLIKRHRLAAKVLSLNAIYEGVLAFSKLKESDIDAVMERLDPRLSWSAKDPFVEERDRRMCMILEAIYVIIMIIPTILGCSTARRRECRWSHFLRNFRNILARSLLPGSCMTPSR